MFSDRIGPSSERSGIDFELRIGPREGFPTLLVPSFVDEGMKVVAPYRDGDRCGGIRCVVVAAGTHARVRCESRGYERWFHVSELRVEEKEK